MSIKTSIKECNESNNIKNSQIINISKIKKKPNSKNIYEKNIVSFKQYKNLSCFKCNQAIEFEKFILFRNQSELIKLTKSFNNLFNNSRERIKLRNGLSTKIQNKSSFFNAICKGCFFDLIIEEKDRDKINSSCFQNKEKCFKNNKIINLTNSEFHINKGKDNINVNDFQELKLNGEKGYIKEYNECLQRLVENLKSSVFEVSCFAQFLKIYLDNLKYFNKKNFSSNIKMNIFFNTYIQTKYRLENIYLIFKENIFKFKDITKKIIYNIYESNYYNKNGDLQNLIDTFIYNTNLILFNFSNFINNFNVFLRFLSFSNNNNV